MVVECIPNISEGRDGALIGAAADAVRGVAGCALVDVESDADHNRSVLTFLGEPDAVMEAAFRLAALCVSRIDLTVQRGVHPRMGSIDVIPFVPLRGAEMADCVALSERLGARLWSELGLPVYLYERSARAPHRRNLAKVREGQFEGLAGKMARPEWAPDFGGRAPHPTAGAVAVGARGPLVAFNIDLDTPDIAVAKAVARAIRESSGGLPCVKALGLYLADRGRAQVSINMTDCTATPLHCALERARIEAARYGANVAGCEIIGLAPMGALVDSAAHYLQLDGFDRIHQVIESHL